MLHTDSAALVIIDVQGKLAHTMHDKEALFSGLQTMVKAAKLLCLPILWAEQLPQKLGPTILELSQLLSDETPLPKSCFSCAGNAEFNEALARSGRKQLLVVGIEAHICVTQSTLEFLARGYEVHLVCDAIGARNSGNKAIGLARCERAGAVLSSCEMALFELMREASHPQFKAIQGLII